MLLYYISGRVQFPGSETDRRRLLLERIAEAARCEVDFVQLREKDLSSRDLETLAGEAMQMVQKNSRLNREGERCTRLLVNSRSDVALAAGADGVHLQSDDISAAVARHAWGKSLPPEGAEMFPVISVSCHTEPEVAHAAAENADLAIFAPVFEKPGSTTPAAGLEALSKTCHYQIPVIALGGVTLENISACLNAGAAGVAGIRLFQENDIREIVHRLGRNLPEHRP